jgi:hypothetical protein
MKLMDAAAAPANVPALAMTEMPAIPGGPDPGTTMSAAGVAGVSVGVSVGVEAKVGDAEGVGLNSTGVCVRVGVDVGNGVTVAMIGVVAVGASDVGGPATVAVADAMGTTVGDVAVTVKGNSTERSFAETSMA